MVTKPPRLFAIVLFVSLGLNVFLGGILAGHWLADDSAAAPVPPSTTLVPRQGERDADKGPGGWLFRRMAQSLPDEHRATFEAIIARHRPAMAKAATSIRTARSQVHAAMTNEPFDRATLDAAFAELRAGNDVLQAEIQSAIAEAAQALPLDARQHLADWRAHGRRGR